MASWDETNPLDNAVVSQYPTNERAARAAVKTNFDVDHHSAEDATVGFHDKATFIEQGSDESAVANAIVAYAKEVSTVTELFTRDSAGNIVQLTNAGAVNAFLSGVASASAARTALGLVIGTDVQAYSTHLAAIAGLSKTDSNFIVANGTTFVAEAPTAARTSLGLGSLATLSSINGGHWSGTDLAVVDGGTGGSTASAARSNLGVAIGSDVMPQPTVSTSAPSGGSDGDFWFVREA